MSRLILVLCLVLVSACTPNPAGGSPSTPATSTPTTSPSTTTTTLSVPEARRAFVACLAAESVDVPPFEGGSAQFGELAAALDTTDATIRAAIAACAPHLAVGGVADLSGDPEVRQLVAEQLAAFAVCMRDQGVEDFPDPGSAGGFAPDDVPFTDEGFEAALTACQAVVGSYGLGS